MQRRDLLLLLAAVPAVIEPRSNFCDVKPGALIEAPRDNYDYRMGVTRRDGGRT